MTIKSLYASVVITTIITSTAFAQAPGIKWAQCYGGLSYDAFQSVKPTTDGGTIAIGYTDSNDSIIVSRHSLNEVFIVKTDSNGNRQWYSTYGGSSDDMGYDIIQTADGGYLFVGGTYSNDGDVSGNHGDEDAWVVKIDSSGNIQGQNCFGGTSTDVASAIVESSDGNYLIAGTTSSTDGDITNYFGDDDFWLIKIDLNGNMLWNINYGGSSDDEANALVATPDTGCVLVGSTSSIDGEVSGDHYSEDFWVVKVNSAGAIQREQCFGSYGVEYANGVALTTNNNYIICGASDDTGGDVRDNKGGQDFWVIKVNDTLGLVWQQNYGGSNDDVANAVLTNADGSSYILGYTSSDDSEVSGNHGNIDAWAIQVDSSSNLLWQECVGDTGNDYGNSLAVIPGSDIIIAGTTNSNDSLLISNHGSYDGFLARLSYSLSGIYTPTSKAAALVYPNPANNYLNIQVFNSNRISSIQLRVVDITGRTILMQNAQSGSANYYSQLDVSSLPAGIYFLTMKINSNESVVKKIVKD